MSKPFNLSYFWLASVLVHGAAIGGVGYALYDKAQIDFANNQASVALRLTSHSTAREVTPVSEPLEVSSSITPTQTLPDLPALRLAPKKKKVTPKKPIQKQTSPQVAKLSPTPKMMPQGGSGKSTELALVRAPKPPYPSRARRLGFEGITTLQVAVSNSGEVTAVTLLKSSGRRDCDYSALSTIEKEWRFTPATMLGIPVASKEIIEVQFTLQN